MLTTVLVIMCIFYFQIINLIWYWTSPDYNLIAHKHVIKWTVDDVIHWLADLGMWTEEYKDQVKHQNIGKMNGLDKLDFI